MAQDDYSALTFKDLAKGDVFDIGEFSLTREQIVAFAQEFDPQPYHLDDEAARRNPLFDRISASGWQSVLALQFNMGAFWRSTLVRPLAGAEITGLRWHRPVYAGDRLFGKMSLVSIRLSRSRPDRAIVSTYAEFRLLTGVPVTSFTLVGMFSVD